MYFFHNMQHYILLSHSRLGTPNVLHFLLPQTTHKEHFPLINQSKNFSDFWHYWVIQNFHVFLRIDRELFSRIAGNFELVPLVCESLSLHVLLGGPQMSHFPLPQTTHKEHFHVCLLINQSKNLCQPVNLCSHSSSFYNLTDIK